MPFAALRALGAKPIAPPPAAPRLSDPLADEITRHLIGERLWRNGAEMETGRDGSRLMLRIRLPETRQCDRDMGRIEARRLKAQIVQHLTDTRHAVTFADDWFCERGRKEWVVLVKAKCLAA